jgi:hypothetical protein
MTHTLFSNGHGGISELLWLLFIVLIVLLAIWDGIWKLIALWKSARHGQLAWFICIVLPENWTGGLDGE